MIYCVEMNPFTNRVYVEARSKDDAREFAIYNVLPMVEFDVEAHETTWTKAEVDDEGFEYYDVAEF